MPEKTLQKIKKITPQKPLSQKKLSRISPEIEKAKSIAVYYGFEALPEIEIAKEDISIAKKKGDAGKKNIHPWSENKQRFGGFLEEKICLLRNYSEKKFAAMSQPVMGFYEGPIKGNPHIKKQAGEETFNLEIIGSSKSVSEATIIETSLIMLRERYPNEEFFVEINSIGDKESMAKFTRELQNFCNKEVGKLAKSCKTVVKKDIFSLFDCKHLSCTEVQDRAPRPMGYLSEASRTHFKEVLEYLESLKISYVVNHNLIGSRSFCNETIFEIKSKKNNSEAVVAIGERYNGLAKKIWGKKDISAIGVALLIHPHYILKRQPTKEKVKPAKFFFIQFGFDAKLKSLSLIETLRKSQIPVQQSLSKDKLAAQLATAEKINIPYILIMGQQEAKEDSVVVRNMNNRSQETIPIKELVAYLKKLK